MDSGTNAVAKFFYYVGKPFYFLILLFLRLISFVFKIIVDIPIRLKEIVQHFKISPPKTPKFPRIKPKVDLKLTLSKPHYYHHPTPNRYRLLGLLLGGLTSISVFYFLIFNLVKSLPSPDKLSTRQTELTTKIYDRNGNLLYKIYQDKNRTAVKLSDLPDYAIKATIAIEDKDFYQHRGISFRGIGRAIYESIVEKKFQGGSTITQQLIKNTLLTPERTYRRKIKEAILAFLVEKKYSKDQILEMYLNEVGYGGTAYGIEEASQRYFGIHAAELSLAQATLLAGLPASPTTYSPMGNHPEMAKNRQLLVLQRMVEDNYITEKHRQQALNQSLKYVDKTNGIVAPHFVMYIRELLSQKYSDKVIEQGGLEIKTSLDIDVQNSVQTIVATEIKKLGNLKISNGAALVTNPKTGEILAMVGSKDYFAKDIDGNFNVTTALRQPGSSIKPINYSIALENGFTPGYLIDDSPITYKIPGQESYSPENYDRRYHGRVPLRVALGSSYNVPAVKVLAAFGVNRMIERGKLMGITTWEDKNRFGLSLTLGGGEVKMTDLSVAYGVMANNGKKVDLNPILEIKDSKGKILESHNVGVASQVIKPQTAYLLTNILADNAARTPAFGQNSQLYIPNREVAVKTGTTQNMRDNWTIGYTPSRLAAVWVGNNDNTPMSYVASGVTGASPIWRNIMDYLLGDQPTETFDRPDNIVEVSICQTSYTLPCDGCPSVKKELFVKGTEPINRCSLSLFSNQPTP